MTTNIPKTRKCLHCGKEFILTHELRLFCPNFTNPDGTVQSCKDDFNNLKQRPKYHMFKKLIKNQHKVWLVLDYFFKNNKEVVSFSELKNYGVDLNFPIQKAALEKTKETVLLFIEYGLKLLPDNNYKIFKHGKNY